MFKQKGYSIIEVGCALMFLLFVGLIGLSVVLPFLTNEVVTATITDKERIVTREDSYYLIFTDDEVFRNSDSLLELKFNSSDIQGAAKVGSTCQMNVYGFRVSFLSMYRNITEIHCLDQN